MSEQESGREAPEMVKGAALAIVEEICRQGAMCALLFDGDEDSPFWDGKLQATVDGSLDLVAVARAVIQAMFDPPPAIIGAVEDKAEERYKAGPMMQRWYGEDVWNAGINAALSGSRTGAEQAE